jgi:hypothetical protein
MNPFTLEHNKGFQQIKRGQVERRSKKRGRAVRVDKNMKGTKRGTSLTLRDYITLGALS